MLQKENRLTKKRDFEIVFKKGKGVKEGFLLLRFVGNGFDFTRFAFVVSQKVSKKATVRNKIRRIMSEGVRLKMSKIKKGFDCILVVCPGLSMEDLGNTMGSLLDKAKLSN